jgi:hypothetical protein
VEPIKNPLFVETTHVIIISNFDGKGGYIDATPK